MRETPLTPEGKPSPYKPLPSVQTAGIKSRRIEVRYSSSMFGTVALYDDYATESEAREAAADLRQTLMAAGDYNTAKSVHLC